MSATNPSRVRSGVPAGGQFAAKVHGESDLMIEDSDPFDGMADEEIVRMGQSTTSSKSFLATLAGHEAWEFRKIAAQNPNTPVGSLSDLAGEFSVDESSLVRASAAMNPSTSDIDLRDLTTDPSRFVRAAVASNPHTPDLDLEEMLQDEDPDVRHNASATLRAKDTSSDDGTDNGDEPVPDDDQTGESIHQSLFPNGESNRQIRGHEFLPPSLIEQIPALYSTEEIPLADKQIHAHYFTGACDWYIAELDPSDGTAFGRCDLGMGFPEWGYVNLIELESTPANFIGLPVERDCYFTPSTAKKLGLM